VIVGKFVSVKVFVCTPNTFNLAKLIFFLVNETILKANKNNIVNNTLVDNIDSNTPRARSPSFEYDTSSEESRHDSFHSADTGYKRRKMSPIPDESMLPSRQLSYGRPSLISTGDIYCTNSIPFCTHTNGSKPKFNGLPSYNSPYSTQIIDKDST
jgi:hypothetical protein